MRLSFTYREYKGCLLGAFFSNRPICPFRHSFLLLFFIHSIIHCLTEGDKLGSQYEFYELGNELRPQHECSFQNDIASAAQMQQGIMPLESHVSSPFNIVSVEWYGATGDGETDDTQAFADAWNDACSMDSAVLLIPGGKTYLLSSYSFNGPCGTALTIELAGTLIAPPDPSTWSKSSSNSWIQFSHLHNLIIEGGGTINGQGQQWWAQSCKVNKKNRCRDAPTALKFNSVQNLKIRNLSTQNAQQIHVSFHNCYGVQATNLTVVAPSNSPNTDGIHISATQKVVIQGSTIGTGDDCISIVSGSSDIRIKNVTCGPGHGISVGSLGKDKTEAHVSLIVVDGATLIGTTNGLRIKTWQGGSGSAIGFRYQNIQMINVAYPIIIDQYYCDSSSKCPIDETSAVQVSHIFYENITGTSATQEAIKLTCSEKFPCKYIRLQDINLTTVTGGSTTATCDSAEGVAVGTIVPAPCLETNGNHRSQIV